MIRETFLRTGKNTEKAGEPESQKTGKPDSWKASRQYICLVGAPSVIPHPSLLTLHPSLLTQILLLILLFTLSGCAGLPLATEVQKPLDASPVNIEWQASFEDAIRIASRQSKPMMLVFYGVSSMRLDKNVFSAPDVIDLAQKFVCLKIGADQGGLVQKYAVQEFPTVVFADPEGGEYDKFVGYKGRLSFVEILKSALIPVEAEYTLRIKASQPEIASVKCIFRNVRWSSLVLSMYEKHDKIYNISYDCAGDRPGWEEIAEKTWLMKFTIDGMKTVTVQYEVELNIKSFTSYEPEYISYVWDNYGILDGHALFLMPQNLHMVGKIDVHLGLPPGWLSITPWNAIGHSSFAADSVDEVVDSVFCIGEFQYAKSSLGDHEIYAVLCGAEKGSINLEQKSSEMVEMFRDYVMRFGDFPFKRYLGIFAGPTADGIIIHGSAHGAGFAGPMYVDNTFIAHEIFHVWNGGMILQKSDYEAWFKEGFTQYYGYLTPYRTGLYSKEQLIQHLERDYKAYLTKYRTEDDMPLTRVKEELARREGYSQPESTRLWVMYYKGALVASLLDKGISEHTDGRKSLDDLMYYMFHEFRKQQYSSEDILEALNTVTGQDFSQFFSDFIYGTVKVPWQGELLTESTDNERQR